jgi:nucleotide-binding universal stress UspA family protein
MYRHILIPTDGSVLATEAVDKGIAFAKDIGAKVTVLTVTGPFHMLSLDPLQINDTFAEYQRHASCHARRILAVAAQKARALEVLCDTVEIEGTNPHEVIIATAAKEGTDLIVMASHGRRGLSAILLGSETLKVLTHSKTPVLVYR